MHSNLDGKLVLWDLQSHRLSNIWIALLYCFPCAFRFRLKLRLAQKAKSLACGKCEFRLVKTWYYVWFTLIQLFYKNASTTPSALYPIVHPPRKRTGKGEGIFSLAAEKDGEDTYLLFRRGSLQILSHRSPRRSIQTVCAGTQDQFLTQRQKHLEFPTKGS